MSFLESALEHAAMLEQWTLCTVEDVPDDQWAEQPGGLTNHPAWVMGHLVRSMDNVTTQLGGPATRDEAWYAAYLANSSPTSNRADYHSKDELIGAFIESARALRNSISAGGEGALAKTVDNEQIAPFFPTVGRWATHCLLSEGAFHTGQLSAWRRAKGMPPVFEVEANLPRMMASALTV